MLVNYEVINRGVFNCQLNKVIRYDNGNVDILEICRSDGGVCIIMRDYTAEDEKEVAEFCDTYGLEREE